MRPLLPVVAICACSSGAAYLKVRDVSIEGNKVVEEKPIVGGLVTHEPSGFIFKDYAEYDEVSVAKDRERIESYYQRQGYFSARVLDTKTRRDGGYVDVSFRVEEGEPTLVKAVRVEGLPEGLSARDLVQIEEGERYRHDDYLRSKDNLTAYLVKQGYAHAEVSGAVEVDRARHEANVSLRVDAGPLVRFGPANVRGLERVPESAIRARIAWDEGAPLDPRRVEVTQARLYQLGLLASVDVDYPHEGRPEVVPVTISVREGLRHELGLGGGVALDNANILVRPRASYLLKGLWDPLLTLDLEARPGIIVSGQGSAGQLAGEVSASLRRDDLFAPRLRGTLGLTAQVIELETYSARGVSSRVGLERPFVDDHVLVGLGYQFVLLDFNHVDEAITPEDRALVGISAVNEIDGFNPAYKLGAFEESIALDLRDNPLDARDGLYLELRGEEAGPFSGSGYHYLKLTPEARAYVSPVSFMVLAARIRFGVATGELPITQRYFAGGATSQRGFTFRRLSPMSSGTDADGGRAPIGGECLLETGAEVRFDLFRLFGNWLGVAFFLDGGDVTLEASQLDPGNLHWAAGGGLRYNTVVGPVRFDIGYRLNRYGEGEPDAGDRIAFHLTLGQAF